MTNLTISDGLSSAGHSFEKSNEDSHDPDPTIVWRILNADSEEDKSEWLSLWTASPMQHPFAHPELCRLLGPTDSKLFAASLTIGRGHVLYPFFLRDIDANLGADEVGVRGGGDVLRDIISPYGYGGPLFWELDDIDRSAAEFWKRFDEWATENSVVSEFIRFTLFENEVLPFPGQTRDRQLNFVRDLNVPPDEMWQGASFKKVRKNIRRASKEGVDIVFDQQGEFLDDFLSIYIGTMVRRASNGWYRFERSFFESIHTAIPGRFVYVFARVNGTMISADLILLGADTGYDFLGGTYDQAFSVRPNDLVKVESMNWLYDHGFRRFVIGGGLASGDSLERFKRGFAPAGAVTFRTGERIICRSEYQALAELRKKQVETSGGVWDSEDEFFPAYRRGLMPSDGSTHSMIKD